MAKYRTEKRRINPNSVKTKVSDPAAVEFYKRKPRSSYGGWHSLPTPHVERRGGRLVATDGNHRIEAAKRAGRSIEVEITYEVGGRDDKKSSGGFFSWLFS